MAIGGEKKITVPALEKALDILETLSGEQEPQQIKILSERLNIPQASAFRIVNTLVNRGYLFKAQDGRVGLGPRNALLHEAFLTREEYIRRAEPYLVRLRDKVQAAAELAIYSAREIVFVMILESPRSVTVRYRRRVGTPVIGSTNPAAVAVLSLLGAEERKIVLNRMALLRKSLKVLEPVTEKFFFSRKPDHPLLDSAAVKGVAVDRGVQTPDVARIAAPVCGHGNRVYGSIGLAGPVFYFPEDALREAADEVKNAARELSLEFGCGE